MRRSQWVMWLGVMVAIVLTAPAMAREAEVILKDGRRITGQLVAQTANTVTVKIAVGKAGEGIETTFPRDQIKDIQIKLTLDEQYQQKRAALKNDDYPGRYDLARWLAEHKTPEAYQLALTELSAIIADNPAHEQAKLLRQIIADDLAKSAKPPAAPMPPAAPTAPTPAAPATPAKAAPVGTLPAPKMLDKDEINLIRVYEVDLASKPRVQIIDKTVTELLKAYRDRPEMQPFLGRTGEAKFKTLEGWQQLDWIFKLQAREFYSQVQMREEPKTIKEWKQSIHPSYVVRTCGQCHGEGKAPGFYVITQNPTRDEVVFTNYMLARRTRTATGAPLIDKTDPTKSILLQYGLPPKDAITPHPDVRGWRHFFTGPGDKRFVDMVEWAKHVWGQDYPIEFTVPGAAPAAAPVTPSPTVPPGAPPAPTP